MSKHKVIGMVLGLLFVIVLAPLIAFVVGWYAGWIVSLVFPETTAAFLAAIGFSTLSMSQFGAMIAFIGSFFRNGYSSKS